MVASLRLNPPAPMLIARTTGFLPHGHPQAADSSPGAGRNLLPSPRAAARALAEAGGCAQAHARRPRRASAAPASPERGPCLNDPFGLGDSWRRKGMLGSPQKGSSFIVLSPSLR